VNLDSDDPVFRDAVMKAVDPIREVVEKYAVQVDGKWRFKDEDCDPLPTWDPPPPAGT
jgi:hypothetical protein